MTKSALQRLEELHEAAYTKYKQTGNSYYEGKFTAYDIAMQVVEKTGWQLVPKEPTENQIISAMEASLLGRPSVDDDAYVMSIIDAYLSAAPKYTGENT